MWGLMFVARPQKRLNQPTENVAPYPTFTVHHFLSLSLSLSLSRYIYIEYRVCEFCNLIDQQLITVVLKKQL